jgi:NAD+ kinase
VSGRAVTVFTHARPHETGGALRELAALAHEAGVTLRLDPDETAKHQLDADLPGVIANAEISRDVELAIVLGGDGTILKALRTYSRTRIPVFAVNFGEVGFLATVEPDQLREGFELALRGELDLLALPAIELGSSNGTQLAMNDVSVHRRVGERVAELAYALGGEEIGSVRCDGLVVATPAGSTGYNLANGGPVMAWGVEGMVVSFIAPHSLTARALVIAPRDVLRLHNRSVDTLEVSVDGRPVGEIAPDESLDARFVDEVGTLAQLHGSTFYRRLREKFGRLAR